MENTENKQEILDKRYMQMATIWSENSYCNRRKVGALIVKNKMIILTDTMVLRRDLKMCVKMNMASLSLMYCMQKPMLSQK